jgi:hypothetical protein
VRQLVVACTVSRFWGEFQAYAGSEVHVAMRLRESPPTDMRPHSLTDTVDVVVDGGNGREMLQTRAVGHLKFSRLDGLAHWSYLLYPVREWTLRIYFLQTIFRKNVGDPLGVGSFYWPFPAHSDADAKARATNLLAYSQHPNFVKAWETGNAVRILLDDREIAWKSFDRQSAYADWT